MYKILNAEKLSANVFLMDVEAPRVAKPVSYTHLTLPTTPYV